ncbi:hypothetical protein AC578_2825 [Pseudocercospora eumusae]|uniref:Uncharacterized protein n=1 Tax=Pseudocercospora eumusae TaxID=321146 RepID=A0A139H158_9PEZI|nr:hypothetical protein AC578_2825 [Pseudocercospora eumusae]
MHLAPPPNPRDLLPPLLACLPTSFVSPRPPPALLPLLSPILRQRVNFLASSTAPSDGWLPLLAWDAKRGAALPATVGNMNLEPHPVSGELELDEVRPAKYRRLDEETLQSRLEVDQFSLLPIFVWCEKDEHGGTEPGWKLSELRTMDDIEDGTEWYDSPLEANDAVNSRSAQSATTNGASARSQHIEEEEDDANDDYWGLYDQTPGRTPAQRSPAPPSMTNRPAASGNAEADYYARYGQEVQPAMDAHDPDEEQPELRQITRSGDTLMQAAPPRTQSADYYASLQPHASWKPDQQMHDSAHATATERSPEQAHEHLSMPRPISPTTSHSSVDRLEERAAEMSYPSNDTAQLAVKQHISTDVKSLYRLAKASGMDRAEFQRVVQTELEVLSMMDQDD